MSASQFKYINKIQKYVIQLLINKSNLSLSIKID